MITLKELSEKLKSERRVAIFSHIRPDGDTVGSSVALALALKKVGVGVDLYCSDNIPEKFFYLDFAKSYKSSLEGEYSAFISIDGADLSRLGVFAENFARSKNTYNIDHHISNDRYAKYNYVVDNASNCENVFNLINEMGIKIDKDIADALLTGVVTDTGNFAHKNVTESTLQIASVLFANGGDLNGIIYNNFKKQSKQRAKLFGMVMSKIRFFLEDAFAVITVRKEDLESTGAKFEETEGFIDFVMGIDGVEVGACITETEKDKYKVSLRSKKTDVNAVASVFGGGGHILASGCQINGEYEEVIDKITYAVKRFI